MNFLLAMFIVFPLPLFKIPYFAASLYLASGMKPRKIDALAIIACATILFSLLIPGAHVLVIFFLPFILFSTPFGLILLALAIVVLVVCRLRRGKKTTAPSMR